MDKLSTVLGKGLRYFGYFSVILIIGACAVRPNVFGITTPDTTTPEEWDASVKSEMIPDTSPLEVISEAPKSQGQYAEESAEVFSTEFVSNLGDSQVTFENTYLNQQECQYLVSEGEEKIHYTEFIASSNLFLAGEYFFDSWSVTPLEFYIEMLIPFCEEWTEQQIYELYGDYMTEVVQPSIVFWNSDEAPDEVKADIRNTHEPRLLDYSE